MNYNNLAPELQPIADVILRYYTPGTIEDHDSTLQMSDFIDLFAPVNCPKIVELKEILLLLGFMDKDCKMDDSFFVKLVYK